jgi:hypothetical protein
MTYCLHLQFHLLAWFITCFCIVGMGYVFVLLGSAKYLHISVLYWFWLWISQQFVSYLRLISFTWYIHHHDGGGSKHLWNAGKLLPDYIVQQPRGQPSSCLIFPFFCVLHQFLSSTHSSLLTLFSYLFLSVIISCCIDYSSLVWKGDKSKEQTYV